MVTRSKTAGGAKAQKTAVPAKSGKAAANTDSLFPTVGIGASAGGLEAFTSLLQSLAPNTGMAFVLIQHLDPKHESILSSLLSRASKMPVHEVTNRMKVEPNHVYVIPPKTNMTLEGSILYLTGRVESGQAHMPIDEFFVSLAKRSE